MTADGSGVSCAWDAAFYMLVSKAGSRTATEKGAWVSLPQPKTWVVGPMNGYE